MSEKIAGGFQQAGKNSFPQTPFLFARLLSAEGGMGWETLGGSIGKILWILLKESSDFFQQTPPALKGRTMRLIGLLITLVIVILMAYFTIKYQLLGTIHQEPGITPEKAIEKAKEIQKESDTKTKERQKMPEE